MVDDGLVFYILSAFVYLQQYLFILCALSKIVFIQSKAAKANNPQRIFFLHLLFFLEMTPFTENCDLFLPF